MELKEKKELFLHWLVYQCAKELFTQKLSFAETKQLYHIIIQSKLDFIAKKNGSKVKSIKATRTFIFKKIKKEYKDKALHGKDIIFHYLLFYAIPSALNEDFFVDWKNKFESTISKEDKALSCFDAKSIKELPSGVKSF